MRGAAGFMRTTAISAAFVAIAALQPVQARAADLPSTDPISKLSWRGVGPFIGGRVVAVAGVPTQPNVFYMGAVDGGVWKSTNYGESWKNISDKWPSASDSIGALAVAPTNPNVIYAGTGESDIRGNMITGDGVYKSNDAGKTWFYAGLRDTHTTMDLLVDPHNPNIVYVASMGHVFVPNAERGVFKSTDGGHSWRKVLFVDDNTGVVDLAMDSKNPRVLYAAAWQAYRKPWHLESGGPGSGLYKSTDGGEQWTNITARPGFPTGVLGKIGVAVAPSNPNILYASVQAKEGGIFRSDDAGGSWKRMNGNMQLRQRAFYYMEVFVDPKDPNTIYVPQVSGLFVSHNAGKTFTTLHAPHGDNHIVWINPNNPNILLEGNDGGATVSVDRGKTWSSVHNQPTGQFYHVNLDERFPFHIYGAQQDEGAFEGPSASSQGRIDLGEWKPAASGESTWVVPEPGKPGVSYGSGYYTTFMRYDPETEQYQGVSPWPRYREGDSAEQEYRFAWTHPILFSPTNPNELLVGSQYVHTSTDLGKTWRTISPDLTRNDKSVQGPTGGPVDLDETGVETYPYIESLAVSPLDGNVIWAGSADGLVHVTTDHGATWTPVSPTLPGWAEISSIEPSHVDKGTAYLTASRYMWDDFAPYVFRTTDFGRTWVPITAGLPADQYALAVRQDPSDPDLLFLGTKNTVYASFDRGSSWRPLTLNLPHAQVRDIAINPRQGSVVAATHGRAFWVLDNLALLEQLTRTPPADPAGSTLLFAPERAWLTQDYGTPSEPREAEGAGENPEFGATVYFRVPKSYDGRTPVRLSFADANGAIIRSFDLHLKTKTDEKADDKKPEAEAGKRPPLPRPEETKATTGAKPPEQAEEDEEDNPLALPADLKAKGLQKKTAIEPGMNAFRWNLRYPDATEVKGFYVPGGGGGYSQDVTGPAVVPGTYRVILDYGGSATQQPFEVALDPRIKATQDDLNARFALEMQIHRTLDQLNRTVNRAIDARDRLKASGGPAAAPSIDALDSEIAQLVELRIQSDEGDVLFPLKLRSQLASLASDVDLAYARPAPSQYAVFNQLQGEANAGEQRIAAILASIH
jgi:photosystem II stability/assembly factor-like uncharacterized protein